MCTAALKQEFNQVLDQLPSDKVSRLLAVAYDMLPSASEQANEHTVMGVLQKPGGVDLSAFGALKGGLFYMADDFDETPDCFKEYM